VKNAYETLFVENVKLLGEASKANIKRTSLPAILFRGAFQNVGRCEKLGNK